MTKPESPESRQQIVLKRFWEANIRVMGILLLIWALVSLGAGVLMADVLNAWNLPGTGYPLGFWFAQQGAIVTFVALILIYAIVMNRLESAHRRELEELSATSNPD